MLLQATTTTQDDCITGTGRSGKVTTTTTTNSTKILKQECSPALHILDCAPAPGWTAHVTKDGRIYYCNRWCCQAVFDFLDRRFWNMPPCLEYFPNHVTRTAGWLPPAEAWKTGDDSLPYGWERALDDSGKPYFINHINKTTTYETPVVRNLEPLPKPEPRTVTLKRSPACGFGFVAGSEKPVIVRFVNDEGPSIDKLLPGDHILSVNGEDVKLAPREHVIVLIRSCVDTVTLTVCQPEEQEGARKSTFLSATKRARLKDKPSRVRFAESVCVNGAPLFPPSVFSLGDLCVPPMANVLKVFLENGQTKSFKYDAWTTVQDVVNSLQNKLCIQATEHFSLVVEHIKSLKRNKLTLLDPQESLARIAARPGAHKLRCLFRVAFVPQSAAVLAQKDLNALDYLYTQCCNDVLQERFSPELQFDTALRLSALQIYQHALSNNVQPNKLTVKNIEREFGLERFIPVSLIENMKRKEIKKLLSHFLKLHINMAGPGKQLTALQAKLHYLDIVSQLPSYGAKCFSAGPRGNLMEQVILISPKFGISQITGTRNSVFQPMPIANIDDMRKIEMKYEDEFSRIVLITLDHDKLLSVSLEEKDANELVLVLCGYFRLNTGHNLPVDRDEVPQHDDLAPPYLSQHRVVPEKWSYFEQKSIKTVCFALQPAYQNLNKKTNGLYNTVGRHSKPPFLAGYSLDSNMNNSISNANYRYGSFDINSFIRSTDKTGSITETKNEEVLKRVREMHQLVENSEKYLTEQENLDKLHRISEWQETSIDLESDSEEGGKLKHSDSLLLLNKLHNGDRRASLTHAVVDLLKSDAVQSESDNDSIYTPHSSPKQQKTDQQTHSNNRISFGLRSPETTNGKEEEFELYLQKIREQRNNVTNELDSINDIFVFDPDIIDLTSIPPPLTPDELDATMPIPINLPPKSFADSTESINKLNALSEDDELEKFLASVTVPPPTQKITPAIELTPEEIMAYIIPPPPSKHSTDISINTTTQGKQNKEQDAIKMPKKADDNNTTCHNNSTKSLNIIDYATVDRKSSLNCCSKNKTDKNSKIDNNVEVNNKTVIQPLPRRSLDEKPPERPPKDISKEHQRSKSLGSAQLMSSMATTNGTDHAPKLPPRGSNNGTSPKSPHLLLPPKKPPLPPVPPLEILRQKKILVQQQQQQHNKTESIGNNQTEELKTASIGSPHLQRSKRTINEIKEQLGIYESRNLKPASNAVTTPTSPHLGKTHLTTVAVQINSPDSTKYEKSLTDSTTPIKTPTNPVKISNEKHAFPVNGLETKNILPSPLLLIKESEGNSNGNNLLEKTDLALAGLLIRLDQIIDQCSIAQVRGGGKFISEDKFQLSKQELTSQCLQLVTSSKMLVIAMSDPNKADLPKNLAICLTILRRLTELSQDLVNHTTAPLQTRNLILKIQDVTETFRQMVYTDIDRNTHRTVEDQLASHAEKLANVLSTLLRSLRVFSP